MGDSGTTVPEPSAAGPAGRLCEKQVVSCHHDEINHFLNLPLFSAHQLSVAIIPQGFS